jgi:hypothetical protein
MFIAPIRSASAEPARVNLTYARRTTAAASCPDEATFRELVAARLGYDPFESGGGLALQVELKPEGKGNGPDGTLARSHSSRDPFAARGTQPTRRRLRLDPQTSAARLGRLDPWADERHR